MNNELRAELENLDKPITGDDVRKAKNRIKMRKYYQKNGEKVREYMREYYCKNKEHIKEQRRKRNESIAEQFNNER